MPMTAVSGPMAQAGAESVGAGYGYGHARR